MNKLSQNITYIVFLLLFATGIALLYTAPSQQPEDIALNHLVQEINEGKVQSIVVKDNDITVTLNDDAKTVQKTTKESGAALSETLTSYGVDREKLQAVDLRVKEPGAGKIFLYSVLPLLIPAVLVIGFLFFMMKSATRGNAQALSFGNSRARMIDPKDKNKRTTFKDVAGNKEAKEELSEVVDFLKTPKKFLEIGAKIPKGVLLLGPPGTGKTLIAKAVAGEAGVPFFTISGSEFVEMFVGVGASRVRDLFKQAKKMAPAIVFIDEIDAVGRQRGAGVGGGHDEREQTLNQILVEMDGFESGTNVIVIAATNRPDVLDPALLRPGRFDRRVTVDLPNIEDRIAILRIHAKGKPLAKDVNVERLAQRTPGFSGADLANLMNEAAILAARNGRKKITMDDAAEAIEKVMLGPARKSRRMDENETKIVAYHEAGHALVGASLEHADPVQKVSIISRGSAGGYTLSVPEKDKTLRSYKQFLDELAVFLGGYTAEKLVFGDVTTGPSNDLERATHMARAIVTRYGMSDLGPRTFGKKEEMVFLGRELSEERDYSDKTADEIDRKVSEYIAQAQATAERILREKRDVLERIATTLLAKETIEKDEFEAIIAGRDYPSQEEGSDTPHDVQETSDAESPATVSPDATRDARADDTQA